MSAENTVTPKLVVRDLNFYYRAERALKDINLTIPEKMVTAFIGPSGCGKSTMLRTFNLPRSQCLFMTTLLSVRNFMKTLRTTSWINCAGSIVRPGWWE